METRAAKRKRETAEIQTRCIEKKLKTKEYKENKLSERDKTNLLKGKVNFHCIPSHT